MVSVDYTTKGIDGFVAYHYAPSRPRQPEFRLSSRSRQSEPEGGSGGQRGLSCWPSPPTNRYIGYRGSHKITGTEVDFIYQLEVQPQITSCAGSEHRAYTCSRTSPKVPSATATASSGIADQSWGKLKIGTTYSPYKKSTDRMNPFLRHAGRLRAWSWATAAATIESSSAPASIIRSGTSRRNSAMYSVSTPWFSPGPEPHPQQSSFNPRVRRIATAAIQPGSGNLPLACDDGGYDDAYSVDLKFETGPFYATAAYEMHKQ